MKNNYIMKPFTPDSIKPKISFLRSCQFIENVFQNYSLSLHKFNLYSW